MKTRLLVSATTVLLTAIGTASSSYADGLIAYPFGEGATSPASSRDVRKPIAIAGAPETQGTPAVYVASSSAEHPIAGFYLGGLSPDATMSVSRESLGVVGIAGIRAMVMAPDGAHLYAAGRACGAIAAVPRSITSGALDDAGARVVAASGACAEPQEGIAASSLGRVDMLAMDPAGENLYGSSRSGFVTFGRDVDGNLNQVGFVERLWISSLAFSSDGTVAYAAQPHDDAVVRYNRSTSTGMLSSPTTLASVADASQVALSPDGAYLYTLSSKGIVTAHSVSNGALVDTEARNSTGDCGVTLSGFRKPQNLRVSADGARLYVGFKNQIAVFDRATNGTIRYRGSERNGSANCYTRERIETLRGEVVLSLLGNEVSAIGRGDARPTYFKTASGPIIDPDEDERPYSGQGNSYAVNEYQHFPIRCGVPPFAYPAVKVYSGIPTPSFSTPGAGQIGAVVPGTLAGEYGFTFLPIVTGAHQAQVTDACGTVAKYSFNVVAADPPGGTPTRTPTTPGSTPPVTPTPTPTLASQVGMSTIDEVISFANLADIRSIPEMLSFFPSRFRRRFALMHTSRSIQDSSRDYPRAILYGDDATLTATFNGDPSQAGFERLEFLQWRGGTERKFETRTIHFEPYRGGRSYDAVNDQLCMGCHAGNFATDGGPVDPKPLWDYYKFWPGAFRAVEDVNGSASQFEYNCPAAPSPTVGPGTPTPTPSPTPDDEGDMVEFLSAAPFHSRYRFLAEPEVFESFPLGAQPNAHLSLYLSKLNVKRIARRLADQSNFAHIRPALLALYFCPNPTESAPLYPAGMCQALATPYYPPGHAFSRANHDFLMSYLDGLRSPSEYDGVWRDWTTDVRQTTADPIEPPCGGFDFDHALIHSPEQLLARGLADVDSWFDPWVNKFTTTRLNNTPWDGAPTLDLATANNPCATQTPGVPFCACLKAAVTRTPGIGCPTPTPTP